MNANVKIFFGPPNGVTFVVNAFVDMKGKSQTEVLTEASKKVLLNLGEEIKNAVVEPALH